MDYYVLKDDFYLHPHQLFIKEIGGFDNVKAQIDPMFLIHERHDTWIHDTIIKSGELEVDYTESFFGFCVVSEKIKRILEEHHILDVSFIPLRFDRKTKQSYYLMLDVLRFDCVDEAHSEFQKFVENDPVRPDLAGHYRSFFKLIIDPNKTDDVHIFRIKNSDTEVLISQTIKDLFEQNGVTGARFIKATL